MKTKLELGGEDVYIYLEKCPKLTPNKKYTEQHLLGRKLLKQGLKDLYDLEFSESMIELNENGKPFLKDYPEINFNISHSEKMIIVAFSNSIIGVDIEDLYHFREAMIYKVFSNQEKERSKFFKDQDQYFTRLWTLKESYFKCQGTGLVFPLTDFSVKIDNPSFPTTVNIPEANFYQNQIENSIYSVCLLKEKREGGFNLLLSSKYYLN